MPRKFQTKYGYFTEDGLEYVITNPKTPRPWINVISNGNYGVIVSQVNGGFSWITHSNINRLTRWQQDLIQDNWGKFIYLRDEETGVFWSPTIQPLLSDSDEYECRHGIGYTIFNTSYNSIQSQFRVFVPFGNDLEIWSLKLKNLSGKTRKIGIYTYFEWCLGAAPDNHREFHKSFIETKFDDNEQILFAKKRLWEILSTHGHWNVNWDYTAYFACDLNIDEFEGDKEKFIGLYRSPRNPIALERGYLTCSQGKWNDSIASLKKEVLLSANRDVDVNFFLGAHKSDSEIRLLMDKYRQPGVVEKTFQNTRSQWEKLLNGTAVSTPDEALNFMTNHWLKYQAISGRIWGRAAYYQQSGAYGFRDQLQDSQVFLYLNPELTEQQILLHAQHQFSNGEVLHWWHPITEEGLKSNFSDDLLWLPFVTIQCLKETANWSLLKKKAPFYDDSQPVLLLTHCLRAIDKALDRFSERGLPLILAGDWNDGLSAVGLKGKGESIWLAHFLYYILKEFSLILNRIDQTGTAIKYLQKVEELNGAINRHGWDGEWFWRASKDDGSLIGSQSNEDGKIFLNPQIWSIIAGSADKERQIKAMDAVEKYLETETGPLLLFPAYKKPDPLIGYLSRYAPGLRENGGVYTHAATWLIWAASLLNKPEMAYRIYKKLCPIYNGMNPDRYAAEPYVTPGNIDGLDSPHYGRGGWSWYTGSAAWLFRVTVDHLIGIQADYDGLLIKPCLPLEWNEIKVKRLFRGTTYSIHIHNKGSKKSAEVEIIIEGKKLPGNFIPPIKENREVEVVVNVI
jgi:cellobiose phosphorylase